MRLLREILDDIDVLSAIGSLDIEISGIAYDSRKIENGYVFVCIEGFSNDGHKYAHKAAANGAKAIIVQKEIEHIENTTIIKVSNTRQALAVLAAAFYGFPADKMNLIGVTGTNGKTTTTYLLADIYKHIGKKTGVIGTIHNLIGERIVPTEHTTPESSDLQQLLAEMYNEGVSDVAMEVSSHALSLARIATLKFKGAIFTNLTQDHLDFHSTMDEYYLAKSELFKSYFLPERINIINIDDFYGKQLLGLTNGKIITYAINNKEADFTAEDIKLLPNGLYYRMKYRGGYLELNLKLLGEFNVYNSLAVAAYAISAGIAANTVKEALENAKGVPGRFELVDQKQPFTVAVDYAHTPDGLQNILSSACKFANGKLITVFGCGGNRDRTKRPKMGAIAASLSDQIIVTSDNPRSEEPMAIINDIVEGIPKSSQTDVLIEADRRKAIEIAFKAAQKGDVVIIAGKGHETYQIIKDQVLHFDDREEARLILRGMGYEN